VEQTSQGHIASRPVVAEIDPELASFKSELSAWIGDAIRAPYLSMGLQQLCQRLEWAIARGLIALPERFCAMRQEGYARRLVYEDPSSGVCVLAMVWAPGQATPLHDHSGLWGIEAVLTGEIENVPFNLIAQQNGQYYFHQRPVERVAAGSSSYLMPPFEHHITRNVSQEVAISLNIYGGEMPACNIFLPTGPGTYMRQRRALSFA
jgi:3-mercaptopropionate dioxygenase